MTKSRNVPVGTKGKHKTPRIISPARVAAKAAGLATYQSETICAYGHDGVRRTYNGACVECHRGAYRKNPVHVRGVNLAWRRLNMHRVAKYKGHSPPTRPAPECCELCGKKSNRVLVMDHDHETNLFRGWLCHGCNTKLGGFLGTIEGLLAAVYYLARFTRAP